MHVPQPGAELADDLGGILAGRVRVAGVEQHARARHVRGQPDRIGRRRHRRPRLVLHGEPDAGRLQRVPHVRHALDQAVPRRSGRVRPRPQAEGRQAQIGAGPRVAKRLRRHGVRIAGQRAARPPPWRQGEQDRHDRQLMFGSGRAQRRTLRAQLLGDVVYADLDALDPTGAIAGHDASSPSPSGQWFQSASASRHRLTVRQCTAPNERPVRRSLRAIA